MKKKNRSRTGGILSIICGILALLGAVTYSFGPGDISGLGKGDIPPFVPSIIFGVPVFSVIIAILAIVGGIFALQRKKWRWALAGAIAGSLSFMLLGIPAIIYIAMSRDEFPQ